MLQRGKIKFVTLFSAIIIVAGLAIKIKESTPKERVIGITGSFMDIPCNNPSPGKRCSAPDPSKIAFYIKVPTNTISYPPAGRGYNNYVGIGLFVSDEKIESTFANSSVTGASRSYLVGDYGDAVRISYSPKNELSDRLQRLNLVPASKYAEVPTDIPGYRKYDDTTCPETGTAMTNESLSAQKRMSCTAMREAIYVPISNSGSIISCMQIIPSSNILALHTCQVSTKLIMGGRARYSIQPKHVVSGKWIELNSKIVKYLNSRMIPAK